MTRTTQRRLAVALAVLAVLAACTDQSPAAPGLPAPVRRPTSAATSPARGAPAGRSNPDEVAVAALTALYSVDTRHDRRPADAAVRALPWLTTRFSDAIRTASFSREPGALWVLWTAHAAVVTAAVSPAGDDRPPDTAQRAWRQFSVKQVPPGRDGWRGSRLDTTVFVTLARTSAGWAVERVLPR